MKKILIFDANSLLNRAFYGVRPLSTRNGLPTNAVFGYINILKKHLDAVRPDFAVAAFDVHAPTFRHRYDASYKAGRKPMPEDLRAQLPYLREATVAMGLPIAEKEGFEADDVLGTLSAAAEQQGFEAVLVTGDRDSFQLVSPRVTLILVGTHRDETITPEVLKEKFGLTPPQMIEVKALAGDSSDNISGVKGIGEKTALKLVSQYGNLEELYRNPDEWNLGKSIKEKLLQGRDDAFRSRYLATICREVPDLGSVEDYPYEGFQRTSLRELLIRLEFSKMLTAFGLEEEMPFPKTPSADPLQGSMFDEPRDQDDRASIEAVSGDALPREGVFLFFDEEHFYTLFEQKVCRIEGDLGAYLRQCHPIVCDYKAYLHRFSRQFGSFAGMDAEFDLNLAAYVINSQDSAMTLSRLALVYLKESLPFGAESDPLTALPLMERIYPLLRKALEESGAQKLYYEIEKPLAYVLAKMEKAGFQVSREGIRSYGALLEESIEELQRSIRLLAGEDFNLNSPKQLGRVLFEKMHLPAPRKTKTGYATDAETLSKLRHLSPIVDLILSYRTLSKLHGTYVQGLLSQVCPDGRIHTVFHQMVTATGRLSSAEPNLQNIPVRTEPGREMRRFFTAKEEGYLLVDADYSQIELRLLAHMAEDEVLQRFFLEGKDVHTKTASEIFHVPPEQVTPEMRKSAKAVNFGIIYGIGEYSLSQDLKIPRALAGQYIREYFALFPKVRNFLDRCKEEAREKGFITTLFGRKRQIPELKSEKKNLVAFGERVAMNAPIQGTAADIIKLAMVRVDQRLEREGLRSRLVLQVHDELILECPAEEAEYAAALLSREMEEVVNYSVPLVAEAKIGFTWYDTK